MKKNKIDIVNVGQRLLVASGTKTVTTGNGKIKEKTVWENHGFFPSRQLALKYAQRKRPGKKIHIEGQRFDASEKPGYTKSES